MPKLLPTLALALSLTALPAHAEIWSVFGINGNDTGKQSPAERG